MAPRTEVVFRRSGRKRKSEEQASNAPNKRRQHDAKKKAAKTREDSRSRPKRSKNSEQTDDSFATKPDSSDEARCVDVVDLTGENEAEAVPPKVSRKNKDRKSTEKRLKIFRKQAPQKYNALMHRATTQRMVVIDRRRADNLDCPHETPGCPMEEVDLAGSTGNIYTVKITHVPECTCPDFQVRRNPQCKHILNVLVKVLKAPDPLYYQAAFLTSELEEIFTNAGPLPTETVGADDKDGKRKPIEGDCPICCEELSEETETIVWCQAACGNNLHKSCFDQWASARGHGRVTCPYCRTPWQHDVTSSASIRGISKSGTKNPDGYVNVAEQLGMSGTRDYSTYHEYWVRGQRQFAGF